MVLAIFTEHQFLWISLLFIVELTHKINAHESTVHILIMYCIDRTILTTNLCIHETFFWGG